MSFFRNVAKSQTLLINEQSRLMQNEGVDIIKFGFGQSPFAPPEHIIESFRQHAAEHSYTSVQGLPELRSAVADFHNKRDNLSIKAENVLVAPGSKILIFNLMGMFKEVDILIPAPSWVSYQPQAELWGYNQINVEARYETQWLITAETLENAIKKKSNPDIPSLLILNYPGNPTGMTYSRDELIKITEVCRKYNIYVVSDEIYGALNHGENHFSIAQIYPEKTVITSGLSKWSSAGGWRIGVALFPDEFDSEAKETLLGLASETYSCACTPSQYAAIDAYDADNEEMKTNITAQCKILPGIGTWCAETLSASGVRVHIPQGGFYLFPDFSPFKEQFKAVDINSGIDLCGKLLSDTGVALLPGESFGVDADTFTARLSYVDFDGQAAVKAIFTEDSLDFSDEATVQHYAPKVAEGISRICSWLKEI